MLHHVFPLDTSGFQKLAKVLKWVSHAMVTMPRAYDAIDAHVSVTCEQDSPPSKRAFIRAQCRHAFLDFALKLVHFKCFGSRKKLMISSSGCLLRCAGHALGSDLVSIMSTMAAQPSAQHQAAALVIAKAMSTWSCIMMVKSHDLSSQYAPVLPHESSGLRELQRIAAEAPWRTLGEWDKVPQPLLQMLECMHTFGHKHNNDNNRQQQHQEDPSVSAAPAGDAPPGGGGHDRDAVSPSPSYYYDEHGIQIPAPLSRSSSSSSSSSMAAHGPSYMPTSPTYDPYMPWDDMPPWAEASRQSRVGGKEAAKRHRQHVWDHCWRELAAKKGDGHDASHWTTIALFRPLLLDAFVLASNIVGASACYCDQQFS
jgi:hypothetical protein